MAKMHKFNSRQAPSQIAPEEFTALLEFHSWNWGPLRGEEGRKGERDFQLKVTPVNTLDWLAEFTSTGCIFVIIAWCLQLQLASDASDLCTQ